jgi:hypothetical protein
MKQSFYPSGSVASTVAAFSRRLMAQRSLRLLVVLAIFSLGLVSPAHATHFRYGNLTWRTVTTDATKRTIEFKVSQAWRASYFGSPAVGAVVTAADVLDFGDGTTSSVDLVVTSVDAAADNFYGEAIIEHTYPASTDYTASFTSCCRLSNLSNNAGQPWYVSTTVNAGSGNNSPVSTLQPVVNVAAGQATATFQLPAFDPDGDPMTYSLASAADENSSAFVNAPGMSINPTTGLVTMNTAVVPIGRMLNGVLRISDGRTSVMVDFIIMVNQLSVPPVFDYSVTPPNGNVYQLAPGQSLAFQVRASDSDPGDVVSLRGIGLPPGATMTPDLPTTGNPVSSSFTWTPTALGTTVINFVAQDLAGAQTTTAVVVNVSTRPRFDVPPTPANGSIMQHTPGTAFAFPVQASSPGAGSLVSIVGVAGLPASATFTPALPTAAANPTSTQFSWTPVLADWGPHTAVFTAANAANEQATHSLQLIVNSAPAFASTPAPASLSVRPGQAFSYNIVLTDPDVPYGDQLEVENTGLPAWLTIVPTGNGTATLSGTPPAGTAGTFPISLIAADIYHHGASYGLITQNFTITVLPCSLQLTAVPTNVSCNGLRDGRIALTVAGGTAPYTYAWTGPAAYASAVASPTGLAAGTYSVTVTATATGCRQTAQVILTEPALQLPVLRCAPSVTVTSAATACGAIVTYAAPVGSHPCLPITTTRTAGPASGTLFPVGTTTVTYTARDNAGHATSCSFLVTVNDVTRPVLYTRNISVCLSNGVATITPAQVSAGAYDACGIASLTLSRTTFTCANLGSNTVTLTATDVHGNVTTATAVVTVTGTVGQLPAIVATAMPGSYLNGTTLSLGYGSASAMLTASGGTNYTWSPSRGLSNARIANPVFTAYSPGTYTYTVTATTAGGCQATRTITLRVEDVRCGNGCGNQAKVIVCHNGHEICISVNAVPAHLAHGDKLGSCNSGCGNNGGDDDDDDDDDDDKGHHSRSAAPAPPVASIDGPSEFAIFPNPASDAATVSFRAVADGKAKAELFNQLGQRVLVLFDGEVSSGQLYTLPLDGQQLAIGLYECHLVVNGKVQQRRLIIAR